MDVLIKRKCIDSIEETKTFEMMNYWVYDMLYIYSTKYRKRFRPSVVCVYEWNLCSSQPQYLFTLQILNVYQPTQKPIVYDTMKQDLKVIVVGIAFKVMFMNILGCLLMLSSPSFTSEGL